MSEELLSISQIYTRGKENLERLGQKRRFPPDSVTGASVAANRKFLDSLFFETKFFESVEADTSLELFGVKLKTPVFSSPMGSAVNQISSTMLNDITRGVGSAGSLMMIGIGGSADLQQAIDTGTPVVKIVKPYRRTELIFEKVRDAESRGCVAVGMDIDHSYGRLRDDGVDRAELFGPQSTEVLKQVVAQTRLPFIVKGVLSVHDAQKAVEIGAAAVIVSNHGYAAFDCTVPSMVALPRIVESVGDKLTVLIDTGFKTGNDVLKALAFGARAVGFANSMLLAWGADGTHGVETLIKQITAELRRTMSAAGCANLAAVNRAIIGYTLPMP